VASVIKVMGENAERAAAVVARTLREFPAEHETCPVGSDRALEYALITNPSHRDPDLVKKLDAVAGRVLRAG
jgi:5'-methylthioadenosine phosphorylase